MCMPLPLPAVGGPDDGEEDERLLVQVVRRTKGRNEASLAQRGPRSCNLGRMSAASHLHAPLWINNREYQITNRW